MTVYEYSRKTLPEALGHEKTAFVGTAMRVLGKGALTAWDAIGRGKKNLAKVYKSKSLPARVGKGATALGVGGYLGNSMYKANNNAATKYPNYSRQADRFPGEVMQYPQTLPKYQPPNI